MLGGAQEHFHCRESGEPSRCIIPPHCGLEPAKKRKTAYMTRVGADTREVEESALFPCMLLVMHLGHYKVLIGSVRPSFLARGNDFDRVAVAVLFHLLLMSR